jgi:predicted nucleotidyltransferase
VRYLEKAEIKKVVIPIAEKYGIAKMILFGSNARGEARDDSDYDFLISRGEMKSLIQYMSIVEELEDMLSCHVDVVTDTSSDEEIINTAIQEGVLLYEKQRG